MIPELLFTASDAASADCTCEPIHRPGGIQPIGVLLALADDLTIECCAGAKADLGIDDLELIGRPLDAVLPWQHRDEIAQLVRDGTEEGVVTDLGEVRIGVGFHVADASYHRWAGRRILELIRSGEPGPVRFDPARVVTDIHIRAHEDRAANRSLPEFAQHVTDRLKQLTGYDRVLVYQFAPDWSGEVIAESRNASANPFLGLHFPASDIPPQARELYLRNRVRVLADVTAEPVPLVPVRDIDLSLATCRAFSPVHREYLGNMGVAATLVASVIVGGQLWGFIICHHDTPRLPGRLSRSMIGAVAETLAVQINLFASTERERAVRDNHDLLRRLERQLETTSDWAEVLTDESAGLMEIMRADGLAVLNEGVPHTRGSTPPAEDILRLARWMDQREELLIVTDRLAIDRPEFSDIRATASGVLALRVPWRGCNWIIWFRSEQEQTIVWAGDPLNRPTGSGLEGRLSPRSSFAAFRQSISGRSRPWSILERSMVEEVVRPSLLDAILSWKRRQSAESEARHSQLLAQVRDAIIITDLEGRVTYWNRGAEELYGWTSQERTGYFVWEFYTPELAQKVETDFHNVVNGQRYECEYQLERKDGTPIWVEVRVGCVFDSLGRPTAVLGVSRDMTERKRAETALRESEERFRLIAQATSDAFWEDNRKANRTWWSDRYFEMLRMPCGAIEPSFDAWVGTIHPDDRERVIAEYRQAIHGKGDRFHSIYRFIRADQAIRYCQNVGYIVRGPDGKSLRIVGSLTDITDLRAAEMQLRNINEQYRMITESIQDVVFQINPAGIIEYVSPSCERILGYPPNQFLKADKRVFSHPDDAPALERSWNENHSGRVSRVEWRCKHQDGHFVWMESLMTPIFRGRELHGIVCCARDISDRKLIEEQFRQAQKMEAIGHMAGGIAHDFNNILTLIIGYGSMLLDSLPADDPNLPVICELIQAGKTGASLTQQLLAFGRRQILKVECLNLNEWLMDKSRMLLSRLIGEDIDMEVRCDSRPLPILADRGQLDQVLINLAINARDAMPNGGRLTIETRLSCHRGGAVPGLGHLERGEYAVLVVADTGIGMDPATMSRIFDPFFTTKEAGHGTGLGLSMVYGVVAQMHGFIGVESEPGEGTTFSIYLPIVNADVAAPTVPDDPRTAPRTGAAILLVEDNKSVRELGASLLTRAGYQVWAAATPSEALNLAETLAGPIDLVLTDVVLPEMNASQMIEKLSAIRPGVAVLYTSGYPSDSVVRHGVSAATVHFVQKPFVPRDLLAKISEILSRA